MTVLTRESISDLFIELSESQGFIMTETLEEAPQGVEAPFVSGSIMLNGPEKLKITMMTTEQAACEFSANALGIFPEEEEAQEYAQDMVREFLNIMGGHVATRTWGAGVVCELTIPEVHSVPEDNWKTMGADASSIAFMADDAPVLIKVEETE